MTHNAVLDAEAELVLDVGPLDADLDDGRARDDAQLHHRLRLRSLQPPQNTQHKHQPSTIQSKLLLSKTFNEIRLEVPRFCLQ